MRRGGPPLHCEESRRRREGEMRAGGGGVENGWMKVRGMGGRLC